MAGRGTEPLDLGAELREVALLLEQPDLRAPATPEAVLRALNP